MNVFGNAKYIKAQSQANSFSLHDPLPFFRREFTVNKNGINNAQLFVQAPGFAEFFINGKPVTEDKFISPVSNYSKILWYNTYDVTQLLQNGINTVGVIASNGFFNESFQTAWNYNSAEWRDAPQFLLCLKINGEAVLVSDSSWKVSRACSHIIFSHLRSGEYVDMRKYDNSWLYSGYDTSHWKNAVEKDPLEITGELRRAECQPVRETEIFKPVSITKAKNAWLIDFGKNSSGYMQITLEAPRGKEIIFRYCEEISQDGRPKHNYMNTPNYYGEENYEFQTNKLIASGGRDTFKPKFSYHGFRYVIIEGLDRKPSCEDIQGFFIHNDVARKSNFVSGNEIINFIYTAGIRSSYSNMFWSLTDCPTREKLSWTNDAQASAEQLLINFDILPFYKKWFEDILADQTDSGELHGIIPSCGWGHNWGPVCDYFLFELPWRTYIYTGDSDMLIKGIPYFEKYRDFLKTSIENNHEFILGDWLGNGNSNLIPKEFIRDAYMIKVLKAIANARRIANSEHQSAYDEYNSFCESFMQKYISHDGGCTIDEQTACSMMIILGLYKDKSILTNQLIEAVKRDGIKLTSGMVGIQYLYDALSESGRPDLAYRIITESDPGYKTWYDSGATTLWETWDGVDRGSHNHHMYSNVLAWFFKSLLGIAPCEEAPAFKKITVNPQFMRELGFVKGYEDTPNGRIDAEWKYKDGGFVYTITLPEGIYGEYRGKALKTGTNTFFIKEN